MRLLVTAEQLRLSVPGGIGTYVRGLLQGLHALPDGPDVRLWASRAPRTGFDPVAALGAVKCSALSTPAMRWAWDRGWTRWPEEADVVHATSLAVPPSGPGPMSVMIHDLAWRHHPDAYPPRGRRWHEAALGRALQRGNRLLAPSRATADDLVAAGAAPDRVTVVEEGCDHLGPPDETAAAETLQGLGVDGDYLLTVSTLEPRKNLPRLVAAYQEARPRLPQPWPLVVVGPVGWGPELTPQPGVVLAGPLGGSTLASLYHRARVVAYVPLLEGFGLPAVEAMHAGTPVVASPIPSTAGAALEVDPLDVNAIAAALVRAATDEATRTELVAAGSERAGKLTWEKAARHHVEVWQDMLSSAPTQ